MPPNRPSDDDGERAITRRSVAGCWPSRCSGRRRTQRASPKRSIPAPLTAPRSEAVRRQLLAKLPHGVLRTSALSPFRRAVGDTANSSTGQGAPGEISAGGDAEEIDTRITMPSRRPGSGRDEVGSPKVVKLIAPRNLLARRPLAPSGTEPAVRNAVEVVVSRREGIEQHNGERSSIIVRNAASGGSGYVGGATDRSAKPRGSIGRPTTNANLIVKPVVVVQPRCDQRHQPNTPRFCSIRDRRAGQDCRRHQRHHDQAAALTSALDFFFFADFFT